MQPTSFHVPIPAQKRQEAVALQSLNGLRSLKSFSFPASQGDANPTAKGWRSSAYPGNTAPPPNSTLKELNQSVSSPNLTPCRNRSRTFLFIRSSRLATGIPSCRTNGCARNCTVISAASSSICHARLSLSAESPTTCIFSIGSRELLIPLPWLRK